jgi:hypothetical protein
MHIFVLQKKYARGEVQSLPVCQPIFKPINMKQPLSIKSFYFILIVTLTMFAVSCASSGKTAVSEPVQNDEPALSEFEKALENTIAFEGLFTIHQDTTNGSLKMEINKDQLNREFIYFGLSQDGVLEAGHFRGNFRDNKIIEVRRYFDRIEFVHVNTGYYFDEESPLSRASSANISNALLFSGKITVEDSDSGSILIDADPLFLTESLHQIKPSPSPFMSPGQYTIGNLSRDKSKYRSVRSYPKNTDVTVEYVYETPYPTGGASGAVTDRRSVKIAYQHTFIEMPENDYQPRFADPRVGYFTTQVNDQVSTSPTPFRDLIHRWNLVKKDPDAELSEPVEPIVWWIENTTPYEFREAVIEGTLAWNEAFEAAGFKNAIQVKVQPDDADWEAGDIRYNVLRWTSSPIPPFGGYGPSFVNPRTGQILGADVMLEWGFFRNRSFEEDVLAEGLSAVSKGDLMHAMDEQFCSFGTHMHQNNLFGMSALQLFDASPQDLEGFQKEAMMMLTLHEIGHTLGLNHNMQASTLHSPEDIHDMELANTVGLTGSVMDYSSVNVNADRDNQGRYYDVKPGPYDIWAIEFGYKPELDDEILMNELLARSTDPAHAFGNDADDMRSPGKAIDPRVMVGDMSSDPVAYGVERIELSRELMDGLLERFGTREGQSYQELRNAYMSLMGQIRTQTGVISRQIGGVYRDRAFIGQEGGTKPFEPVPADKQREAMDYLSRYLFSPEAFQTSHEVYNYLQIQRRGFNFFSMSEDPKIHDLVLSMQGNTLSHILHPNTMKRITDSRTYGNSYTAADVVGDLTGAIFRADARGNVNTFRQNLQIDYVNRLIAALESDSYDHISKSALLYNLQDIRNMMDNKGSVNPETRAHTAHVKLLIDKALD